VDADPDWERPAPVARGTVVFRLRPRGMRADDARLDSLNARLFAAVMASGAVRLSHAEVGGRYVLRLVVGDTAAAPGHVQRAWEILRAEALRLGGTPPVLARS
jgi:aromatic-L-amino-acid decarboxylase